MGHDGDTYILYILGGVCCKSKYSFFLMGKYFEEIFGTRQYMGQVGKARLFPQHWLVDAGMAQTEREEGLNTHSMHRMGFSALLLLLLVEPRVSKRLIWSERYTILSPERWRYSIFTRRELPSPGVGQAL